MAKNRGLYGQSEGNETNPGADNERLIDNQISTNDIVTTFRNMWKNPSQRENIDAKYAELLKEGWDARRLQAALGTAMQGIRLVA